MARATERDSPRRRRHEPEARRQAILDAGLSVFAAEGFAAAKLDDVASRAGVAKGTIYLYFRDKEDLFEQIVRGAVAPVLARANELAATANVPTRDLLAHLFEMFRSEILGTDRKLVIRLILSEGARFPKLAAFYHREVVSKGLALVRGIIKRGVLRGEVVSTELERFPHLVFAPLLMAVVWDGLFEKLEPLDVAGMLGCHCDALSKRAPKRSR